MKKYVKTEFLLLVVTLGFVSDSESMNVQRQIGPSLLTQQLEAMQLQTKVAGKAEKKLVEGATDDEFSEAELLFGNFEESSAVKLNEGSCVQRPLTPKDQVMAIFVKRPQSPEPLRDEYAAYAAFIEDFCTVCGIVKSTTKDGKTSPTKELKKKLDVLKTKPQVALEYLVWMPKFDGKNNLYDYLSSVISKLKVEQLLLQDKWLYEMVTADEQETIAQYCSRYLHLA